MLKQIPTTANDLIGTRMVLTRYMKYDA
jgi:hypothetical protein